MGCVCVSLFIPDVLQCKILGLYVGSTLNTWEISICTSKQDIPYWNILLLINTHLWDSLWTDTHTLSADVITKDSSYTPTVFFGKNVKCILVHISPSWAIFRYHTDIPFLYFSVSFLYCTQNFPWTELKWLKLPGETFQSEGSRAATRGWLAAPGNTQPGGWGGLCLRMEQINLGCFRARSKKSHKREIRDNSPSCQWGLTPSPLKHWHCCAAEGAVATPSVFKVRQADMRWQPPQPMWALLQRDGLQACTVCFLSLQLTNPCLWKLSVNAQSHEQKDSEQVNTAPRPHTVLHSERNSINYSLVHLER